jgi:hypothetical protein
MTPENVIIYATFAWPSQRLPKAQLEKLGEEIAAYIKLSVGAPEVKWEGTQEKADLKEYA